MASNNLKILLLIGIIINVGKAGKLPPVSINVNFNEKFFDGTAFLQATPIVYVLGDVTQEDGVHKRSMSLINEGRRNVLANCVGNSQDWADCPYNISACTGGFTIAFWMKMAPVENDTTVCHSVFGLGRNTYTITRTNGDRIITSVAINNFNAFCVMNIDQTEAFTDKWTHIALRASGIGPNDDVETFINGSMFQYDQTCFLYRSNFPSTVSEPLSIGCRNDFDGISDYERTCGFDGLIDEFLAFNTTVPDKELMYIGTLPEEFMPVRTEGYTWRRKYWNKPEEK